MKRVHENSVFKILSYIIIPVLLITIVLSSIYSIYISENEEFLEKDNYYDTEIFNIRFGNDINSIVQNIKHSNIYYNYHLIANNIYMDYYLYDSIDYIVVDEMTGKVYTNSYPSGIAEQDYMISEFKKNSYKYVFYENNEFKTDVNVSLGSIVDNVEGYSIFAKVSEDISIDNTYYYELIIFNVCKKIGLIPVALIPISVILLITLSIYLIISIGHKKNKEGINLFKIDKLPLELYGALCAFSVFFGIIVFQIFNNTFPNNIAITLCVILVCLVELIAYCILATCITIFIKQIKAKILIKSTITYSIITSVYRGIKKVYTKLMDNINIKLKVIVVFITLFLATIILFKIGDFALVLLISMWIAVTYLALKYADKIINIRKYTEKIFKGNSQEKIDENDFFGELKKIATYLNDIAGGFSNAISEKLKSERLKTDLITNVSHDLKTPLTSIINYVDLLKGEDIKNKKAMEYIEVLDNKSQRLKKLTEDLVEASKASSGTIRLDMKQIELNELLNQIVGEFEDKFNKNNLQVIMNFKSDKVKIMADDRYIYRVFENIFSNVSKYAMPNSRVYIDLKQSNNIAQVEVKNISKDTLNISKEELMERFTRGDKSRNTEGSGLGIAIAKSLTNMQDGEFELNIDGDLFKVILKFNTCK